MNRGEDSVLGGVAVGGAMMSLVVGAIALPTLATGALFTAAAIFTYSTIASSISGLIFSVTGIRAERRLKAEHVAQMKAKKEKKLLPWKKPGILGWGITSEKSPKPGVADVNATPVAAGNDPHDPVGHSFIPLLEAPAAEQSKLPPVQALTAAFDPAAQTPANDMRTPPQTPAATPKPKSPVAPPPAA